MQDAPESTQNMSSPSTFPGEQQSLAQETTTRMGWNIDVETRDPKGKGLNSIPIRLTVAASVLVTLSAITQALLFIFSPEGPSTEILFLGLILNVGLAAGIIFREGYKVASSVRELRNSTEALIAGDFDAPVTVECACEVGGLADSFRAMTRRLNSNILRMNVLAYTDPVTKLPNRAVITHVLGLMGRAHGADEREGALLFIDLDGFKHVNDTLGHEAGDELLRQVSQRIVEQGFGLTLEQMDSCTTTFGELCQIRPTTPVFARFAGDEFIALLPGEQDRHSLEILATRILAAVNEPFTIHGNEVRVGASLGIAQTPADTDEPEKLLTCADIAMYAAKEAGKNRYRFFDASLRDAAIERSQIEADLRKAIEANGLTLHFQPKLDTRTLKLLGVEALARWEHPTRGLIPPSKFIEIAEKSGLMPELGSSIFRMAVQQLRVWLEQGIHLPVAINVSAVQLEKPTFVSEIAALLQEYAIDPALIEIEVTESMVTSNLASAKERMASLRAIGVKLSIDDFGTGYSNLSQLANLPFNALKIDKSLIDNIGLDQKSDAIVAATIQMAHALGLDVVAEGIETALQHNALKEHGGDVVQGFLFARPMPAAEIFAWERGRARNEVPAMRATITASL